MKDAKQPDWICTLIGGGIGVEDVADGAGRHGGKEAGGQLDLGRRVRVGENVGKREIGG